jgi:small basic protein
MIFYMLRKTDGTHIFGLNLSLNALWAKSYSNMTFFIGYINNAMIKLTIYSNSLMGIDEQITNIFPKGIHVFIQIRGAYKHKNIRMVFTYSVPE